MKIAIGTDDKKTIRKGHFCESRYFLVTEILNAQIVGKELRDNSNFGAGKENQSQAERVTNLLNDCGIFMAASMEEKSLVEIGSRNVDCIITNIEGVDAAISSYIDGRLEEFKYYDANANDLIPCPLRKYV
ncbi:MAG: hypothetical protein JRJ69_09080 [Deltaproteobacteria bacterium]|nr:hypothetical protein [Deltaproteobacteria bacterium]MBW1737692.1 hypothetical protein [Deltaproteobacteria bacterium]MBW1911034.1 hypothetical protein [Deltaproteobacteria bacterium]MBW2033635.1 hypothetical protein [Deltaproteobacteria bacterium]MBW2115179.1 hypothetical protein [Deltaproteobacteria bacterium]